MRFLAVLCLFFSSFSAYGYPNLSNPVDLSPELIGGTVADPAVWPASPWIGNCSSTIIGQRVLITAAHCVSNGGSVNFTISSTRYSGRCTHHASYRGNSTADWALCLLTQPVAGVKYESIATASEAACAVGKKVLWTGYGCQRWGGGIDGKFRVGEVSTTKCPSGTDYDVVTRGSVALCSGDSGGGGYVQLVAPLKRLVVGINSRSNTTDTSYVSSVFNSSFRDWAKTWGDTNTVKICGVHSDATDCATGDTPDDPSDPNDPQDPAPTCVAEQAAVTSTLTSHVDAVTRLKACLNP